MSITTEMAARIVAAYVANNNVPLDLVPHLIEDVHRAFGAGQEQAPAVEAIPEKPVPVVAIKKSVTPDYIVCIEDGKKFRSLKRHLMTKFGMTPKEYREKWGLPDSYPMVAPNYAATRSALAKAQNLGKKRPSEPVAQAPARKKIGLRFA